MFYCYYIIITQILNHTHTQTKKKKKKKKKQKERERDKRQGRYSLIPFDLE